MAATVPTISYAKTNRESKKGEDFSAAVIKDDAAPAAFAVFDGHSGMETARICSEKVCQRLIEKGPPFQAAAVADVLWAVDEEIGTQKIMDGATSQLLLVEKNGDGMRGMFAWTGDSSAVVADMATGKRVFATDSHTAGPDHQGGGAYASERERLEHFRAVRTVVEATGLDTQRDEVGAEAVRTAIADTGKEPTDESVALLVRAFRRSRIIAQTNPDGCETKKQMHVRQRDKDHDANQVWVVSTGPKHGEPGYHDLQMTRSICDWQASDLVLPEPQAHSFDVPAGSTYRVCLASDGLWDVCSFDAAATIMWYSPTVKVAAKRLLQVAMDEYLGNRGHRMMDDDTTVLVIELNPSGVKHTPPGLGCCTVL